MRGKIAAIVLVVIGSFFLLSNLGLLSLSLRDVSHLVAADPDCGGRRLFFRRDRKK